VYSFGLLDQVPVVALSTSPRAAVPEIAGVVLFTGAGATTSAVEAEAALPDPPALEAVTVTTIVLPTSLAATV
jgi:hypothetical protein